LNSKVGVFHPSLDYYGGAEFVALTAVNTLISHGYKVVLFVNKALNLKRLEKMLGRNMLSEAELIVKNTFIPPRDTLDVYPSTVRSLCLKMRCDILIDTYSNCVFPWTDISYIHYPFLSLFPKSRFPYAESICVSRALVLPYAFIEKNFRKYDTKLVLANSRFTAEAIKRFLGARAEVLYPPVSSKFLCRSEELNENFRENLVVTVSPFGFRKGLEKIPFIAKLCDKSVKFVIIGLLHNKEVFQLLQQYIKKLGLTERVTVALNLSKDDVIEYLKKARIYLHTMVGEHFGISIVEAMGMGCIPIVHDSGGAKEFVPSNFRYSDIFDAAHKINKYIFEWTPEMARQMIGIAEQFSEENFSREFMKLFLRYKNERNQRCGR
jgi:glycosyltransferase involved in cell wall biosynthesis